MRATASAGGARRWGRTGRLRLGDGGCSPPFFTGGRPVHLPHQKARALLTRRRRRRSTFASSPHQPDPAQSDSLAELDRWLDARSHSIRLADLLIKVENDLGFSVRFQQPGEKRVDRGPRGVLLDQTWRMHPDICAFTTEQFYEGRLRPRRRRGLGGPGRASGSR